jgi:23S rRNA G2445 N2-methylase RlmL
VKARRFSDEALRAAGRDVSFQPARADADELFARMGEPDRELAEAAERALARRGAEAAGWAVERFAAAQPPLRARLCRLVGRVAQAQTRPGADPSLAAFLRHALGDGDGRTRRAAAQALGRVSVGAGDDGVEAALVAAWPAEDDVGRRALALALGKVGGRAALALLDGAGVDTTDPELRRIVGEARLKLARSLGRVVAPGAIDAQAAAPSPLPVLLHCRQGLERFVVEELAGLGARAVAPGRVAAELVGPLAQLRRSRVALRFGFPLPPEPAGDPGAAVARALTSDGALGILRAFTVGPIRYRLEWAGAGHRRGLTWRTAEAVAARRPELVNDPTASLWEAVVTEDGGAIAVELWPRGLADERFAYRRALGPAASHPTIAAALAHVAGVRADDVVWDPFVGAATELVERARLGPFRRLYGSDLDETQLALGRANLAAADVVAELSVGDARAFQPPARVTLILTNPPLGRRVLDKERVGALCDAFIAHAASVLAPAGRLVWISPRADRTAARAVEAGLIVRERQRVDMGGFTAELQAFTRSSRAAALGRREGERERPRRRRAT